MTDKLKSGFVHVRLKAPLYKILENESRKTGRPKSAILRNAYIEKVGLSKILRVSSKLQEKS